MYILNDYSIDNQFNNFDDFIDSLLSNTIPLFILMEEYGVELLKSYKMYSLKIVNGMSISELLYKRNYPELLKFKSMLHKILSNDPYWENEDKNHDSFLEALEKNTGLISFEHKKYISDSIEYFNEGILQIIPNSYNEVQFAEQLLKKHIIDVGRYLEIKFPAIQKFCKIQNKDYFMDFVKGNDLKNDDINKILSDLNIFLNKYLSKQDLGELSKNLDHNLHEFRTTIADSRKVRIMYCVNGSRLIFLNCFIKKQQNTPPNEMKLGKKLRNYMMGYL